MGAFVGLWRDFGREHDLGQAVAVAQVDEDEAAVVAAVLHPAHEADFLPQLLRSELHAGVRPAPGAQGVHAAFGVSFIHYMILAWVP